jgi:hypothetical protein
MSEAGFLDLQRLVDQVAQHLRAQPLHPLHPGLFWFAARIRARRWSTSVPVMMSPFTTAVAGGHWDCARREDLHRFGNCDLALRAGLGGRGNRRGQGCDERQSGHEAERREEFQACHPFCVLRCHRAKVRRAFLARGAINPI